MSETGPRWQWIGQALLGGACLLLSSVLGWVVVNQIRVLNDIAEIRQALSEKVRAADALHATFATHDEVDLKIERALRDMDRTVRGLAEDLGVRYRGPVNPEGWRQSIKDQRERKERENR